jgi:Domain of unknown function (DUF4470)
VVRTVNELPFDYSGHITILLNDREPMVVLRNMLLLMLLGTTKGSSRAAEVALHFWCSAFLRPTHQVQLSRIILGLATQLDEDSFSLELGRQSVMTGVISMRTKYLLGMMARSNVQPQEASNEIHRIKFVVEFYLTARVVS